MAEDKNPFEWLKGKWDEAWDFRPEVEQAKGGLKRVGQGLGFVESDEEKAKRLALEAERQTQIDEAERIRKNPHLDPSIAAASIKMAQEQAKMYRMMKNRGLSAGEQSTLTGETLTKFNVRGNQSMAVLQMQLRAAKSKEIEALKKEDWELARQARVEKQKIAKLILDVAQMGLSYAAAGAGGLGSSAVGRYLESQATQSAYNALYATSPVNEPLQLTQPTLGA
jgi:hypothetical protein